jgi:hypothetical protein
LLGARTGRELGIGLIGCNLLRRRHIDSEIPLVKKKKGRKEPALDERIYLCKTRSEPNDRSCEKRVARGRKGRRVKLLRKKGKIFELNSG